MSNKVSTFVHKKVFGSSTRKSVMIYFADKASDGGEGIWASKTTIAAELELHRATVIKTINDLVDEGILLVVGPRKHRNGSTVEYDISMPAVERLPDVEMPGSAPSKGGDESCLTRRAGRPVAQDDPSPTTTLPVAQDDTMMSPRTTQTILKPSMNLAGAPAREETAPDGRLASEGFERFWRAHPRPLNRDRTLLAWNALESEGIAADAVIWAAERYKDENLHTPMQYRISSDLWLEQRRWEPQPTAARKASPLAMHWASAVKAGKYVPSSAIKMSLAREMVETGLLDTAALRRIGVYL